MRCGASDEKRGARIAAGFQGTHLRARARCLGADGQADGLELRLRLAQDSAVGPGARLDLGVKREHLVPPKN